MSTCDWLIKINRGVHRGRQRAIPNARCSLGIGDWRILFLLHRILWLNFAHFPKELCSFIIILLLLHTILLLLQFLMKTLEMMMFQFLILHLVVPEGIMKLKVYNKDAFDFSFYFWGIFVISRFWLLVVFVFKTPTYLC